MKIGEASGVTKKSKVNKIALGFSSLVVSALAFGVVAGGSASAHNGNWNQYNNDYQKRVVRCDVVIYEGDSRSWWSRDDWSRNDWQFRNSDKVICVVRHDGSKHHFNRWGDQWDDRWNSHGNWNKHWEN